MSIVRWLLKHRVLTVLALVMIGGGVWFYRSKQASSVPPRYVTATAAKGTLVLSVSGSGQVSAANQVDVKPKVSGTVVSIPVKEGQSVHSGQLLVSIDAQDAAKAVRDAKSALASAQLALAKLKEAADPLVLLQDQNALSQAQVTKQQTSDDLTKTYSDSFTSVSNTFLDLPTTMAGLQDILYGSAFAQGQSNADYMVSVVDQYDDSNTIHHLRDTAIATYKQAKTLYDQNFSDYKSTTRESDSSAIVNLLNETEATTRNVAEAVKSSNNLVQFYEDTLTRRNLKPQGAADTQLTNMNGYTGKINGHLSDMLSLSSTIDKDKSDITNADQNIAEKTATIEKLQKGTDPLDIQSQELAIQQKQNALIDARATLADYAIRSPLDGIVAKLTVTHVGDQVSGSTAVATVVTLQKLAAVSLNEVDAAKVKLGQKATLTFDAIDGLSISGEVAQIDTIGTVSQGVVTYTIKISFDTQDDRVKPGMSVNAAIITDVKQDVLLVPSSAVKTQGNISVVQVFNPSLPNSQGNQGQTSATPPTAQVVQVGLSNDSSTEITSGLNEGDQVVVRTIASGAPSSSATQAPSLFGGGGGRGSFGGGFGGGGGGGGARPAGGAPRGD